MAITVGLLGSTTGFGSTFAAKAAAAGTVVVITVGGAAVEVQNETLEIQRVFCGHDTATCDVVSIDASFQPALDSDVAMFIDGVQEFGGLLQKHTKRGVGDRGWEKLDYALECVGYSALAERRMYTGTLAAGTLKSQVTTLAADLAVAPWNVVVDPSMPDGPTMPESDFENATIWSALTSLMSVTAGLNPSTPWFPRMTYGKVLSMVEVGSEAAPFNVTLGGEEAIHDVVVETTREHHANKITGVFGPQAVIGVTDTFTGDGSTTDFTMDQDMIGLNARIVRVNGVLETLGHEGDEKTWTYDDDTRTLSRTTAPISGSTTTIFYGFQSPFTVVVEDLADQALYGVIERAYQEEGIVKRTTADRYLAAKLAAGVSPSQTVTYTTLEAIVDTGATQTITLPDRQLDDDFLITEIRLYTAGKNEVMRQIKAIAGMQFHGTFRELFKLFSSPKKPSLSGGGFTGSTSIGPSTYTDFGGSQGGDIVDECCESVNFTLNDAEFRALPSVYKVLVPAPGPNKVLVLSSAALFMESGGGSYGNATTDQGLVIAYGDDWYTDASLNYSNLHADKRLFLWAGGGTMKSVDDPPNGYLVSTYPESYNRGVANLPLVLVGWNDSGDYTGGSPLNSGLGRICYWTLDVPENLVAPSACATTTWSDDFESGTALSSDYDGVQDMTKTAAVGYGATQGLQGTGSDAEKYYGYVSKIVGFDSRSGCVTVKLKPNAAIDQFGIQIIRISDTTDTGFAPDAMLEVRATGDGITANGNIDVADQGGFDLDVITGVLQDGVWVELRLEWEMSSVVGAVLQADGWYRLFVNGVQVSTQTGLTLGTDSIGFNPNNYWQLVQFCPLGLGDDLVIGKP
jgi:hypothetical protein